MRGFLKILWVRLIYNMWLVPVVIVVAFAGLALGSVELSRHFDPSQFHFWPHLFRGGPESARLILSTIATSIITITGVAFSVTVVALALAASQYSSRILGNFMRDRTTQLTLGCLSGVFAFCLVILLHVGRGSSEEPFVPTLAVLLSLVIGILGIGVFTFFIHHIASSIQASSIVTVVREETIGVIRALWSKGAEGSPRQSATQCEVSVWKPVHSPKIGYLQNIDYAHLVKFASRHDLIVRMEKAVGDFVVKDEILAHFGGTEPANAQREIADLFVIDYQRTIENDPLFGIRQIVDVALKALSPGVNDVTTAIMGIHQLLAILSEAVTRYPNDVGGNDGATSRLIVRSVSFDSMLYEATEEICVDGKGHKRVLRELLFMGAVLLERANLNRRRPCICDRISRIREAVESGPLEKRDKKELLELCDDALRGKSGGTKRLHPVAGQ